MFTLAVKRKDRHTWITTQHYNSAHPASTSVVPAGRWSPRARFIITKAGQSFFSHVKSVGGYTVTSQVVIHLRGRVTLGAQMNTPLGVL